MLQTTCRVVCNLSTCRHAIIKLSICNISSLTLAKRSIFTSIDIMAPQDLDTNTSKMNKEDLLNRVLEIVKIFEDRHNEDGRVANFLHPDKVASALGGLEINKSGTSLNEASDLVDNIWKYSIKTQHKHFYNALFHGVDTFGMAGGLLSEALNTNNYSHEVAPVFSAVERELIQYFGSKFGWEYTDGLTSPGGSISNMYEMNYQKLIILISIEIRF